jgi:tRNA 2-selenouridine synthase
VLREIGWDARSLEGGYKAFRRTVIADLPALARRLRYRVLCGLTGSGKSRLLATLDRRGAQVLDLEQLAAHRGSVLGNLPDSQQPSQKLFESRLWDRLRRLEPARPVYVESESKKIGALHLPQELLDAMWASACVQLRVSRDTRVQLLKDEYVHFLADPASLGQQLDCLVPLHGHDTIDRWKRMANAGDWDTLVAELLERHYDPAYTRSIVSHYPQLPHAQQVEVTGADASAFEVAAGELLGRTSEAAVTLTT